MLEQTKIKPEISLDDAYRLMKSIIDGSSDDQEVEKFLLETSGRLPTIEELTGYFNAVYETAVPVKFKEKKLLDICGTGGDGKNSFNISTASAFIVAGAGIKVAKWGSSSASSVCGSSNLVEGLGIKFTNDEKMLNKELAAAGITFMHAPLFYPALKRVAPIRKRLGTRTIFNILGPLLNPATPKFRSLGVSSYELLKLYRLFIDRNIKRTKYTILHSKDGYDEVSLTADFYLASNYFSTKSKIDTVNIHEMLEEKLSEDSIRGGATVEENIEIFLKILNGEGTEPQNQVVLVNSAFALILATPHMSFTEAIEMARKSLYSGNASQVLNKLRQIQKETYSD